MTETRTITLRPYQEEAVENVLTAWDNGSKAALIVQPTGTGKTVTFAEIIRRSAHRGRALVLAHRAELIWQAKAKIEAVTGLAVDVEMAENRANESEYFGQAPVIVGTVQTMIKRMQRFRPSDFGVLVYDEAHHCPADTYRAILEYYRQNPDLKLLGVTATPDRADEEALGQVFDCVAIDYELPDAVRDGWLVEPVRKAVTVLDYDLSGVRTTAGDFNGADLAEILESDATVDAMVAKTADIVGHRKTLVFAETVDQAKLWCAKLNELHGIAATHIDGKTDKEIRQQLLADYASGTYTVLTNVGIATEGFDAPDIQCVVMARPTKSRSLYAQMLGRGTRPLDDIAHTLGDSDDPIVRRSMIATSDKPNVLVVDFVGNTGRHKVISTVDILGGRHPDHVIERAREIMDRDEDEQTVDEAVERAEKELHEEAEERRKREAAEMARRARVRVQAKVHEGPIEKLFDVLAVEPARERAWDKGRKPTEKQRDALKRALWKDPNNRKPAEPDVDAMTFTQASQLMDQIIRRRNEGQCSPKQAVLLAKFGYSPEMSFEQASRTIGALAKAGWKPWKVGVTA